MYPAYLDLVHEGRAGDLIATSIDQIAAVQRKVPTGCFTPRAEGEGPTPRHDPGRGRW